MLKDANFTILRVSLAVFTRSSISAESEPIWMKSGALLSLEYFVKCWRNFVFFCLVNIARFHQFPRGPNFTTFEHNNFDQCHDEDIWNNFEIFTIMGHFQKKNKKNSHKISAFCDFRPP